MKELFIAESESKKIRLCRAVTLAVALAFLVVFFGCAPAEKGVAADTKTWAALKFTIDKSIRYTPTIAVWAVDTASGEEATLYATKKAESLLKSRPGALPVWSAEKQKAAGDTDAVSSATPSAANAEISLGLPDKFKGKKVDIFIEANASFDYNDYYKEGLKAGDEGYNDVNGQPSVVWKASLDLSASPKGTAVPEIAGHGDVLGASGSVDADMSHITTARNLLSGITVEYGKDGK